MHTNQASLTDLNRRVLAKLLQTLVSDMVRESSAYDATALHDAGDMATYQHHAYLAIAASDLADYLQETTP